MTVIENAPTPIEQARADALGAQVEPPPVVSEPDPPPEPETRPERAETSYVILGRQSDQVAQRGGALNQIPELWRILDGDRKARSTREALETYVADLTEPPAQGTVLVAVASRWWKPVPVKLETTTVSTIVIGGE